MKDEKQRLDIDVVLNLVHNAQMTKSHENTLTCLLLNVKEVFNHVMLKQLIKILIKLKISINLISWVKCFLQNRFTNLAFHKTKENNHRNIIRFIYFAHFISNLYSILVFKDLRKDWKFTVTQLHWRRSTIREGKEYW